MVDAKQIAIRMSAEDLGVLHDLQDALGVRSQSDIFRMALRALAKAHGIESRVNRASGDRKPRRKA